MSNEPAPAGKASTVLKRAGDVITTAPASDGLERHLAVIKKKTGDLVRTVPGIIQTDVEYEFVGRVLVEAKTIDKQIDDVIVPFVRINHRAWRDAKDLENEYRKPLVELVGKAKMLLSQRRLEQQRITAEEEAKRLADAKAQQDEERLQTAVELTDLGRSEEAEAVLEAPAAPLPLRTLSPPTPKLPGVSFTKKFKYEVTNLALIPRPYLMHDHKKIQPVVDAHGVTAATLIPGIVVREDTQVSTRSQ